MPDRSHGPVPMRSSISSTPGLSVTNLRRSPGGGAAADDVDGLGGDVRPPGRGEARTRCGGDPHHRWRGRVGSIAVQIARQRTDLTVIATASRPETQEWVRGLELTTSSTILVRSRHRSPNSASVLPLSSFRPHIPSNMSPTSPN